MESAIDVMINLSELYVKNNEKENNKVVLEMEKLEGEFATTYVAARQYIDAQKEQSCETSEILSIDLLNRMNISDQSETYRKEEHNISQEVGIVDPYNKARNSMSLKKHGKNKQTLPSNARNMTQCMKQNQSKHILGICRCRMNIKVLKSYIALYSIKTELTPRPYRLNPPLATLPLPLGKIYGDS